MVFSGRLAIVPDGIGFGAPNAEAGALVQALRIRRRGTDAQADDSDGWDGTGVLHGGVEQSGADALTAVSRDDVHSPEMDLVGGFEMTIAIKAKGADEFGRERADNDGVGRSVSESFADGFSGAGGVIFR